MTYKYFLLFVLASAMLMSCQEEPKTKAPKQTLEGTYHSIGYGHLISIVGDTLIRHNHSKRYCAEKDRYLLTDLGEKIAFSADTLVYKIGYDSYYYTRTSWKPAICLFRYTPDQLQDSILNFEIMASTFREHYAYLELNNLDWEAIYKEYRSLVTNETSKVELYHIMDSFIGRMNDQHGNLDVPDSIYEAAQNPIKGSQERNYGDFEVASILRSAILTEELTNNSTSIRWGRLADGAGYLQINAMMLTAHFDLDPEIVKTQGLFGAYFERMDALDPFDQLQMEIDGAALTIEQALADLANTDYLVLDIRFNGGGVDEVGLEMLRYFNNSPKVFGTKKARLGAGFTRPIALTLEATDAPYLKPVFLLTSPQTGSAAEIFAMASMVLPNFTRIGGATMGATSDMLEKPLPNGWSFGLSNEIYQDINGQSYENLGVPININLDYTRDRQDFFRQVAINPLKDYTQWTQPIDSILN